MKFTSGFLLGTVAGVALFAQGLVYIWKHDRLVGWAKEVDASLSEKFGHRKQVIDLSTLSNESFQAEVQRLMNGLNKS